MIKKFFLVCVVLLLIAGLVWAARFIFVNFRGAGPALKPASGEITAAPESPSPGGQERPVNSTGLPLRIPSGFSISVFARNLDNPRVMTWSPQGDLLVSIPSQGRVVLLADRDTDGISDGETVVASGLNRPHGVAFANGKLYIAETNGVAVYDYNPTSKKATGKKDIIDLPSGGNHFSRTIGFGPEGRLYITIGSSCNVCLEKDSRRAAMLVANADGTNLKEFARGLRNSVFFTWHPKTKAIWATDMGRDLLGDNTPPEEVNIIEEGGDYGWPYCYGDRVHDAAFDTSGGAKARCEKSRPPQILFQAHSAPLGLAFIPDSWPEEYRGDLLVSYHGSWNRSQPTGYKVVRFDLDAEGKSRGESDFLSGWLTGGDASGRPVDLLFDAEGNLFVSDDKAGVIYRLTRT